MPPRFDAVQWDDGDLIKCQKHGLTTDEIEYVLLTSDEVWDDPWPADNERRYRVVGMKKDGRYIFVVFTLRKLETTIFARPSARYMHLKEIERYERD